MSSQVSSNRKRAFSCWPQSPGATGDGRSSSSTSNASDSECAGSVDTTIVRSPAAAARAAVAAATVVFPTPPLPVNNRMRIGRGGYRCGPRERRAPARIVTNRSRDGFDLLLQLFERAAHDEAGGPALHETGQRHGELDGEVVVHTRRLGTLGFEAVGAVEPPQHVALDEVPRE